MSVEEPVSDDSLRLLIPSSIDRDWAWVEPLLEDMVSELRPDWTPDQIKNLIEDNNAGLWTSWLGGFVITQMNYNALLDQNYILMWISHAGNQPFDERDFTFIHQYAKDCDARFVEIWSPRPGMARHMEKAGFEIVNTVIRRYL